MLFLLLNVIANIALALGNTNENPTVTIQDGTLVGILMETWRGRQISAFMNIPFAAPPINELRFMPPQPVVPWNGVRNAGIIAPACVQYSPLTYMTSHPVIGVEDCLYLNVYTPQVTAENSTSNLPVLLYFHGGGFMFLEGAEYGPRYLLDHNMIFVTTNYRLGIMGFLSTGDSVVPGNMGLKDQVAALLWIKRNIKAFGGNPNNVTIAGTSAGAVSVQYHFLSRLSRGLFSRGICQSGSVLIPSALQKAPILKMSLVAAAVNCSSNSTQQIINCLQTKPASQLINLERMFQNFLYNPFAPFGPVVERSGSTPFLTQLPYELLRTGNIANLPLLSSSVTQEGLFPVAEFIANASLVNYVNNNWQAVAPSILDYVFTVSSRNMPGTSEAIREFYYGNESISIGNIQPLVQMAGDRVFLDDSETAARLQASVNTAPVYYYLFGYRGQNSLSNLLSGTTNNYGVSHGDDSFYIMNSTYITAEDSSQDRQMIHRMSNIWASFAITGIPSAGAGITLEPVIQSNALNGPFNYLNISSPSNFTMVTSPTLGHAKFWDSLPLNEPGSGRPIL